MLKCKKKANIATKSCLWFKHQPLWQLGNTLMCRHSSTSNRFCRQSWPVASDGTSAHQYVCYGAILADEISIFCFECLLWTVAAAQWLACALNKWLSSPQRSVLSLLCWLLTSFTCMHFSPVWMYKTSAYCEHYHIWRNWNSLIEGLNIPRLELILLLHVP